MRTRSDILHVYIYVYLSVYIYTNTYTHQSECKKRNCLLSDYYYETAYHVTLCIMCLYICIYMYICIHKRYSIYNRHMRIYIYIYMTCMTSGRSLIIWQVSCNIARTHACLSYTWKRKPWSVFKCHMLLDWYATHIFHMSSFKLQEFTNC